MCFLINNAQIVYNNNIRPIIFGIIKINIYQYTEKIKTKTNDMIYNLYKVLSDAKIGSLAVSLYEKKIY